MIDHLIKEDNMNTKIVIINEVNKNQGLSEAGEIIQQGGIVAFPTETVYGLGANALDPQAVQKIFTAKGRPQDNPLIVHVSDFAIEPYVQNIPEIAKKLMERFWPGPLTLIFHKSNVIPSITSAGLNTIGLRMPANQLALELIKEANTPIAAPSANVSGRPSPTDVIHCIEDLDGKIDMILGGETSDVGLESTIVDCTSYPPMVLRPGGISLEELQEIEPSILIDPHLTAPIDEHIKPKAPGMKYRHYAPNAPMKLIDLGSRSKEAIQILVEHYLKEHKKVGIIATDETKADYRSGNVYTLGSRNDLKTIAKNLYDVLRQMDSDHIEVILSETFAEKGIGIAIMNRLRKAASYDVIAHYDTIEEILSLGN
jgi:L-threonylcarbamoyladenylate synthase